MKSDPVGALTSASTNAMTKAELAAALQAAHQRVAASEAACREMEAALRQREQQHSALVETLDVALCRWLPDTTLTFANEKYRQLFGIRGEVAGQKWLDFLPAATRGETAAFYQALVSAPRTVTYEHQVTVEDGSIRHYHWSDTPILAADGTLVEFQSVGIDITERKEAETAQRQSSETARALLNAATESIFLMDVDGTVITANETTAARLGRKVSELIGANMYDILPPEVAAARKRWVETVVREGRAVHFEDQRLGRWIDNNLYPVVDADGQIRRVAIYGQDITVRMEAAAALRESEERFRSLFESSNVVMLVIEPDSGRIVDANPAAVSFYGYPRDELLQLNIAAINQLSPAQISAERQRAKLEQRNYFIFPHRLADGSIRTVEVRSHPTRFKAQTLLFSLVYDISDRMQMEEKYRGLMESLTSVVATVDYGGVMLYMNDVAAQQLGSTPAQLIGMKMHDLFPEPTATRQLQYVRQAMDGDQGLTYEAPSLIQGQQRWHHTVVQPIHDELGRVTCALVNSTDIHDLKTTQQELEELNHTLEERVRQRTAEVQDLYENAPAGYHSLDGNGCVIRINQTELNWLGYTREEVLGQLIGDFFTPASQAAFQELFPLFRTRGWIKDVELEFVRKSGAILPILVNATAIYDDQGAYVMSRSTIFDNTERKAADEVLRRANLEMARAMRVKDEFLANMSHELRTPLNGILTLSEVMLEQVQGPLNERQLKSLRNVEASGQHLLSLINDLLDLSKIEAGKLELNLQTAVVDDICRASLAFVRDLAYKKKIQIFFQSDEPFAQIRVDAKRLKQMLVNLLSNAVKFTPPGGQVRLSVTVQPAAQHIQFSVQDTGIGIHPADLPRLFQPFTQIDSSLARQFEGTGLGLALVKRLAVQHGGAVTVESTGVPGEGSNFVITLPYNPAEENAEQAAANVLAPAPVAPGSPNAPGPCILMVEDNQVSADAVTGYLEFLGYRVTVARSGPEAIDAAQDQPPDLILMDIQLPYMDGVEVTRRLRESPSFAATPIIALTALAMPGDRERCLEAGVTAYVTKPVRMPELAGLVAHLLRART